MCSLTCVLQKQHFHTSVNPNNNLNLPPCQTYSNLPRGKNYCQQRVGRLSGNHQNKLQLKGPHETLGGFHLVQIAQTSWFRLPRVVHFASYPLKLFVLAVILHKVGHYISYISQVIDRSLLKYLKKVVLVGWACLKNPSTQETDVYFLCESRSEH